MYLSSFSRGVFNALNVCKNATCINTGFSWVTFSISVLFFFLCFLLLLNSHLSIAEKEVEAIPNEDQGAKYKVGQPKPKYPGLQPVTADNNSTCFHVDNIINHMVII